jgi:hypothetical protein
MANQAVSDERTFQGLPRLQDLGLGGHVIQPAAQGGLAAGGGNCARGKGKQVDYNELRSTLQASQNAQEHRARQDFARDGTGCWATVNAARSASQAGKRFRQLTGGVIGGAMGFGRGKNGGQTWGAFVVLQRHGHPSRDQMGAGITMHGAGADSSGIVAVSCGKGVTNAFVAGVEAAALGRGSEYVHTAQNRQLVEVSVDDVHDEDAWKLCCGRGGDAWVAASVKDRQHALVLFRRAWRLAVAANSETPGSLGWGTSVLVAIHREGRLAGQGSAMVCLFDGTSAANFAAASGRTFSGRCELARRWLHRGHFPKSEESAHALLRYVRTDTDVQNLLKEMTAPLPKKSMQEPSRDQSAQNLSEIGRPAPPPSSEASDPAASRKRKASEQSDASVHGAAMRLPTPAMSAMAARDRREAADDVSGGDGTDCKAREELEQAGINQAFHDVLLGAGLDLETLDKVSDRDMYLDSLLKDAGVARPGDRVRIFDALRKRAQLQRPLGI